ncbi:hypothetical protein Gotri_002368 [Gossypium trilobum]|uniref:Uncharacterized protein n=1 Tax=Gossypium trilobum TaxID=34281 RepID=A0A7J9F822_9ROSI|nr:hypothetical protein [Gossypium trilobum]
MMLNLNTQEKHLVNLFNQDDLNKRNVAQGGIYLDLTNTPISNYKKTIDDWAQSNDYCCKQ